MVNIFNIAEVIDLGIEKEKKRRDFYALAAERLGDKELKDLFLKLAAWEEAHIQKFTEIKNSLKEEETTESYPGEMTAYMQTLVNDKLYKEVSSEKFSQKVKTAQEAIYYGIEFEKDAILFFTELINYTAGEQAQVIQKLIDEEKQHIVYLALLQQKINFKFVKK